MLLASCWAASSGSGGSAAGAAGGAGAGGSGGGTKEEREESSPPGEPAPVTAMMRPGSLGSTMTPTTSASSPSPVIDQPTMRERLSEPSGSLKTAFQPGSAGTSCAIRMA